MCTSFTRSHTQRGKIWEYADVKGGYVERRGRGPRSYPLRILFSGRNCDLEARNFELALDEPGFGTLMHPIHGAIPYVAPLGEVTRREDLVARAGEVVVECTFVDSLASVFPLVNVDPESETFAAIAAFNRAASADFADRANLADVSFIEMTKATIRGALSVVKDKVGAASRFVSARQDEFNDQYRFVQNSLNVLIGQPTDLALQTCQLIQSPVRAGRAIGERVEGYLGTIIGAFGQIIDSLIDSSDEPSITPDQTGNDFAVSDLFVQAAASAAIGAAIESEYRTRSQAISAALVIAAQGERVFAWRDAREAALFGSLGLAALDVGRGYEALYRSLSLGMGTLVSVGFGLRPERRITLGRPRQLVELAAELYGRVDNETLDRIINDNALTGSQILELPAGTEIAYAA